MLRQLLTVTVMLCLGIVSQSEAQVKPDTPIFLNALPHSGNTYISYALTRFFKLQSFKVSRKSFPKDTLYEAPFLRFINGKDSYLNVAFMPPSKANVVMLHKYLNKVFLNLRDPREALIAHMIYLEKHKHHRFTRGLLQPDVPDEYFSWDYERKVDWQIQNFYGQFIDWIDQWIEQIDKDPTIEVHVGTTEQMVADPLSFFRGIVAFYGADPNEFTEQYILPLRKGYFHFYWGADQATWRKKLTPEQQEHITARLPEHYFTRFGWTK